MGPVKMTRVTLLALGHGGKRNVLAGSCQDSSSLPAVPGLKCNSYQVARENVRGHDASKVVCFFFGGCGKAVQGQWR